MGKTIDETGKRYGRLTVLRRCPKLATITLNGMYSVIVDKRD